MGIVKSLQGFVGDRARYAVLTLDLTAVCSRSALYEYFCERRQARSPRDGLSLPRPDLVEQLLEQRAERHPPAISKRGELVEHRLAGSFPPSGGFPASHSYGQSD